MIKRRFISGDWTSKEVQSFKKLDIHINEGFSHFVVEESIICDRMEKLLTSHKGEVTNIPTSAIFIKEEIDKAQYVAITLGNKEYPQPQQNIDSYRRNTYEITFPVSSCGYKEKQIAPFRIKQEPKWKKNEVMFSLHWEYDSVLVEKTFYEDVFKPMGLDSRDVIIHKSGKISETVVQLIVPVAESPLNMENSWYSQHKEILDCCGRIRYTPTSGDFLPSFKEPINNPICLTQEIFGSEGNSFRRIIVSKELLNILFNKKVIDKYLSLPLKSK
ncbi:hypothetical protein [Aquimarina macrocephali]|uniref:hypothetical protein n=1 Tax=Aquimarina macrocephali TaxID=666563 RepID=UPI0004634AD3|nr:hypothetical protein [Aquimarina macrocephali]